MQALTNMQMTLRTLGYLPTVKECLAMIAKEEFKMHKTGLPQCECVFEPSDIDKMASFVWHDGTHSSSR